MTLRIDVTVPEDMVLNGRAGGYLDRALSAIGFTRSGALPAVSVATYKTDEQRVDDARATAIERQAVDVYDESGGIIARADGWAPDAAQVETAIAAENAFPVRERGKPGAGRARRTKIEIAEDEAADAADAQAAAAATEANIQAQSAEDVKPAISTGEERVSPEDEAVAAQDRADEDAEAAAGKTGLTLDDLRIAVGVYQRKFGMAAAVADVPQILGCKMVDVQPDNLEWALGEMSAATAGNPYARNIVGGDMKDQLVDKAADPEPEAPATATKQQVIDAMIAYAKKFDGPGANPADASTMPFANEDFPRLFKMIFGEGVDKLSLIPATPEAYGKALAGVIEATEVDGFKRGAK